MGMEGRKDLESMTEQELGQRLAMLLDLIDEQSPCLPSINEQEADELGKVIMDLETSGEQH